MRQFLLRHLIATLMLLALPLMFPPVLLAAAPSIAVSIAPIHSLVQNILKGVGSADLLIRNGQSPHDASLAPSTLRLIGQADLVVWIGPALEYTLVAALDQIDPNKRLSLITLPQIELVETRQRGLREVAPDDHEAHRHDHSVDPHLWLSTANAAHIATQVANWASAFDADNASVYATNLAATLARIEQTRQWLDAEVVPIKHKKWMVYHDGYQYFENQFELHPVATVTLNPEQTPGAKQMSALRAQLRESGVQCVFTEPQFNPAIVATIVESSNALVGVLDPVGSAIAPGEDQWFSLMQQLVLDMQRCLG